MTEPFAPSEPPSTNAALTKAEQRIKTAWIAGLISGAMTLLVTILAITSADVAQASQFNAWNFVDVVLIFGLTFGIYRKSRVCAGIMFVYFLISKLLQIAGGVASPVAVFVAVAFAYAFFEGIRGTVAYHRLTQGTPQG